jgi:hypothetical protein
LISRLLGDAEGETVAAFVGSLYEQLMHFFGFLN